MRALNFLSLSLVGLSCATMQHNFVFISINPYQPHNFERKKKCAEQIRKKKSYLLSILFIHLIRNCLFSRFSIFDVVELFDLLPFFSLREAASRRRRDRSIVHRILFGVLTLQLLYNLLMFI